MNQKTLIALGAMLTIALLAFVTMRSPQKGERSGPRERPLPAIKAADVKQLELASNGGKDRTTLKLEGDKWKLTVPAAFPADQAMVKTAIEQLEKLQFGDLVTEKKEKFADLEVSEEKGARVTARDGGGKVLLDAWIGKSVSGFTMVRPAAAKDGAKDTKDQVWQASGLYKYTYAKDAKQWRDHAMLSLAQADVTRLAVESHGKKLVLEKVPAAPETDKDKPAAAPPPESRWKVVEATVRVDPLDDAVANSMVSGLSSLAAADFDDTSNPADVGLTQPRFKVTAVAKGVAATLLIGNIKGDDVWAQVEGRPQVYLLHKYSIERLAVKPIDFRDKTIVKAKDEDLVGLDITSGGQTVVLDKSGTTWKFGKGTKGEVDATKVKPVVTAFDDLKGSSFADIMDPATTGLAKPTGSVTLRRRDKSLVTLKIGNLNKESTDQYVQKVGSPDVLLVKKFMVERFLKKATDLTKGAAPAK